MEGRGYYYTAAGAALSTHFFLQFHEPRPIDVIFLLFLSNAILLTILGAYSAMPTRLIAPLILQLNLTYFTTLSTSIFIYRVFLHRTRHFPGPFWASLSKFWAMYTVSTGEYHRRVRKLHQIHGDFVRVGPREIDICNVDAITPIYGVGSKCEKGPWYDGPMMGSHERFLQISAGTDHQWRRRIWDAGFSSKALREYEPIVLHHVNELVAELSKIPENEVVDLGLYFSFFTFDVMGDLGFGKSFNMLQGGASSDYMRIVQGFANFNSLICTIPWCSTVFAYLPKAKGAEALFRFAAEQVKSRLPLGTSRKDAFSYLLGEDRVTRRSYNKQQIVLEALNLIIGGSDTTSSTLASVWYYLISHPSKYRRLQAEIDAHDGALMHTHLSKFPYLNAVIHETLRLLPPVASGMMHRVTPPEGLLIGETYIPGNVTVGVGAYEVQRDPRYYGQPDEFIPERWIGEGPAPFNRNAFLAFSVGPYGCVGKHLAYQELCDLTAAMCREFEIEFAEGWDQRGYEGSIKDKVISTRVYLPVVIRKRM
ncbi:cytochrome P450 [Lepidopterella palustris CBS 459.81]|uniref:Cytochrome P450 n=1 Tax=Lepidopterella palustris CBS 459.81 TaxID=1314670 RepID=A0A8E2JEQ2_9PEZI|nr:cytochrome P450 [Lepidopterella palustris CBS 459.81]